MRKILNTFIIPLAALCLFAPITETKADADINTYAVEGAYKVEVPAEVSVKTSTNKGTLSINGTLDACYNLEISIESKNNYRLVNSQSSERTMSYTISDDKVVFSKEAGSTDKVLKEYDLAIRVQGKPVVSGEYTDTLTFTMNAKSYQQENTKHQLSFNINCSDEVTISTNKKFVNEGAAYGVLPIPKRTGYDFNGWYTASSNGEKVTSEAIMGSADITVYAQWTPHKLTINYHNDGAEYINWDNQKIPVDKDGVTKFQEEYYGATFSNRTDGLYDSWRWNYRTGYDIKRDCWKIGRDGTKEYKDKNTGDATTIEYAKYLDVLEDLKEGDVTIELYPIWIAHKYTVEYNANSIDALGSMSSSAYTYDIEQKLSPNNFTRTGYKFIGWSTFKTGDIIYTDEQSVSNLTASNNATVTLYAIWESVSSEDSQSDMAAIKEDSASAQFSDGQDQGDTLDNGGFVDSESDVSLEDNQSDTTIINGEVNTTTQSSEEQDINTSLETADLAEGETENVSTDMEKPTTVIKSEDILETEDSSETITEFVIEDNIVDQEQ